MTAVYAFGALGFDFGSLERRDKLTAENGGIPIITNADMLAFLLASPSPNGDFDLVDWTLVVDKTPTYVLRTARARPLDAWALAQAVLGILGAALVDHIAVPGTINGDATLLDGRVVPVIEVSPRNIRRWSTLQTGQVVTAIGASALPPGGPVNLSLGAPSQWTSYTAPPVSLGAPIVVTPVAGGAAMATPYASSTIPITYTGATATSYAGTAVSAASGGLTFALPAFNPTLPTLARIYVRSFASNLQLAATGPSGQPAYVDTSFDAFAPVAGLPGVVDGVYTLAYTAGTALQVTVSGTPTAAATPTPLEVTLFQSTTGTDASLQVPVGVVLSAGIPANLTGVGSVYVPRGLRLTVYVVDELGGNGLAVVASGGAFTPLPAGYAGAVKSLVVEPDNYVGVQAIWIGQSPLYSQPTGIVEPARLFDFMDRVYDLLRNPGQVPSDRAVNYAATKLSVDAFIAPGQVQAPDSMMLANMLALGLALESIAADPTFASRPGADCWDVRFAFIDPRQVEQAPRTYVRLTVDVATPQPFALAPARTWTAY